MARPRQVVYDSEDSEDDFSVTGPNRPRTTVSCPSSPPTPAADLPATTPTPPTDVSDNQDGLPDLWAVPYSPPRAAAPARPTEPPRKKENNDNGNGTSKKRKRINAEGAAESMPGRTSTTSHILEIAIPVEPLSPRKKRQQQHQARGHDELATATTPPRRGRPAPTAAQLLSSPDVIAEPGMRQPLPRPPPVAPPALPVPARDAAERKCDREGGVEDGKGEEEPAKQTKRRRRANQPRRDGSITEDDELLLIDQVAEEERRVKEEAPHVAVPPPEKTMATDMDNSGNTKTKRPRGRPKRKQKEAEASTGTTTAPAAMDAIYESAAPSVVANSEHRTVPATAETARAVENDGADDGGGSSDANAEKAEHLEVGPVESKTALPAAQPAGQPQRASSLAHGGSNQGRVPFRVGLSKKLRIAPLLKSLKK